MPTLTEVFQPPVPQVAPALPELVQDKTEIPMTLSPEQQDELVRRVLLRVDISLERRLQEAVGQLILEHTETLALRLREEIERVVRQSVSQAFKQEAGQ
ncbi:MAG: hypothetical protein MUP33_10425 [Polaromonas sp.]|nr:hypothetical protein [Polaromonas sp.]